MIPAVETERMYSLVAYPVETSIAYWSVGSIDVYFRADTTGNLAFPFSDPKLFADKLAETFLDF